MAIMITGSRFEAEQGKWIREFVMDRAADVASLPTIKTIGAGSMAHYSADGELVVYELAPGGSWVRLMNESIQSELSVIAEKLEALDPQHEVSVFTNDATLGSADMTDASGFAISNGSKVTGEVNFTATPVSDDYHFEKLNAEEAKTAAVEGTYAAFDGWYDGTLKVSDSNPLVVTPQQDISPLAHFKSTGVLVKVRCPIGGRVFLYDKDGTRIDAYGRSFVGILSAAEDCILQLSQSASEGYTFDGWYIGGEMSIDDSNPTYPHQNGNYTPGTKIAATSALNIKIGDYAGEYLTANYVRTE